ncbi:sulfatase family protein [Aegicerativicinus sediminis]|uniref:sulfatase family protein n=1 Tax=Aegicerativicinus sediminis TaxID=2893202 RepID=UPI001E54AC29|nr:sulfatase [Aegicerativicinus sediminis]
MKNLLLFTIFVFFLSCKSNKEDNPVTVPEVDRPNIVLIFMDDMGYGDLGVYGATGWVTPNLDKLASEGMRFTNFHAATAVCSASRAALLTGCYPDRVSVHGAYFANAKQGLNPNEKTIAEILKEKDYTTGIVGKWHLGDHLSMLPLQQGFDEYLGIPYSNDMWPVYYDGTPADSINSKKIPWKIGMPELPLIRGNEKIRGIKNLNDMDQITTIYTEEAVEFIDKHKEDPFFLYLAHSMPHVPLGVSDKFRGKSDQGLYGDVIMEVDWSVGEVMKKLKEEGLEENTVVIFTSDNGPWLNYGNHAGSTGGLREGKGTMWEGGVREPAIIKWPGVINSGSESDALLLNLDILPTIAEIVDGNLPDHKIDGISMLPVLKEEKNTVRNEFWGYYGGELIFVQRDEWKLYFPHKYREYVGYQQGLDGFPGETGVTEMKEMELYNISEDINETTNVITNYPQIANELSELGQKVREELGDRITGVKGRGVRQPGKVETTASN